MEFIWQYGEYTMSTKRLTQVVYIGLMVLTIVIWYSIFTNGFFTTLLPLLIISCIVGALIRTMEYFNNKENR